MTDRWQIYDKDADFFRDTQTGRMYQIKIADQGEGSATEPDSLVAILVQFLNQFK